jgi:hypothetical protein
MSVLRQVLDEDKCYCFGYGVALLRYYPSCGMHSTSAFDIDIDIDIDISIGAGD